VGSPWLDIPNLPTPPYIKIKMMDTFTISTKSKIIKFKNYFILMNYDIIKIINKINIISNLILINILKENTSWKHMFVRKIWEKKKFQSFFSPIYNIYIYIIIFIFFSIEYDFKE